MEVSRWVLRAHSETLTVLKTSHSLVMDLLKHCGVHRSRDLSYSTC